MRRFFTLGPALLIAHLRLVLTSRGRPRMAALWALLMTMTPGIAACVATVVGVSRGVAAGEETLPLILLVLLMIGASFVVFPLLGTLLAALTARPVARLLGVRRPHTKSST